MRTLESFLLTYVLNSAWQVPLVFAAAWLAARVSHRAGPAFQHRLWVSALFVEVLLPACSVRPAEVLRALQHWFLSLSRSNLHQTAQVTVTMGAAHPRVESGLQLAPSLLTAVALLYIGSLIFFAAKLGLGIYRTVALRRRTQSLTLTGHAGQSYQRYARLFGVVEAVVATSAAIAGPMTLGIHRPMLLLPAGFEADLPCEDLDAALAHEFAHMRRRDFTKNLLYEALSLPAAFHPLLWLTHSRIAESRELLCDSIAAEVVAGRQRYARSLLRLASRFSEQPHAATTHAIGIFDANHFKNFERRVMHLTHNPMEIKGVRRAATAALSLIVLCGACTSALAFRMQVAAPAIQGAPQTVPAPAPVILATPHPAVGEPPQTVAIDVPPGVNTGPSSSTAPVKVVQFPATETGVRTENVDVRAMVDANVRATVDANVKAAVDANTKPAFVIGVPRSATGQPAQSFNVDIADASGPNPRITVLSSPHIDPPQTEAGNGPHVSAAMMAGNRFTGELPVYPPAAKAAGIEGTVLLHAIIGKDGKIESLKLISGPDELTKSAWAAVLQWTYKPYLLNGEPVAVDTTITVNYSHQH
jgi:TonB family protein